MCNALVVRARGGKISLFWVESKLCYNNLILIIVITCFFLQRSDLQCIKFVSLR